MRLLPLLLAGTALSACSASGLSAEEQRARCEQFADAVAKARLTSTPPEQLARDVANNLDSRLSRLGSPSVHDPAVKLHQQLHAVELAQKKHDMALADKAAQRARDAISDLAEACNVPTSRFGVEP